MCGLGAERAPRALWGAALAALALSAAADAPPPAAAAGWALEVLEPAVAGASGELQLVTGQPLRMRCEGPESLRWLFPATEESEVDEPLLPDVEMQRLPHGRWTATLHLPNASYYHTGAYACTRHAHPLDSPDPPPQLVQIYVYVADPLYPWVRADLVTTWAIHDKKAVLDCRPNNRSLNVKLLDNMQKEIPMGEDKNGWSAQWSPTLGFTLGPFKRRQSSYLCEVDSDFDGMEILMVMVNVLSRSSNLSPPRVHGVEVLAHAVLGKSMELQCFVNVLSNVHFNMEWLPPLDSTAEEDGRRHISPLTVHSDSQGPRFGTTNLTVVNITERDAGSYMCLVTDYIKSTRTITDFFVKVMAANESFIDVSTRSGETLHRSVRLGRTVAWKLDVVSHPTSPKFTWFTPAGKKVQIPRDTWKFVLRQHDHSTGQQLTLFVKNASLEDRGLYTLRIQTPRQERVVNLTLTVLAPPVVRLQAPVGLWPLGAARTLRCTAVGSPMPSVQWEWRPCPDLLRNCARDHSGYQILQAPVGPLNDVGANSTLVLRVKSSGVVTCRAANAIDDAAIEVSLQVTDLPGSRSLEAWNSRPLPAVEGDDLHLLCGALRENFTEWPLWRHGGPWDEQRFQITRFRTSLSLRSQLRIHPASVADSGSYECYLEGTTTSYRLDVKPQQYLVPLSVNVNDSEWVVHSWDHLTLLCNFDGLPRPTITWYKDGKQLDQPLGGDRGQFRLVDHNRTLTIDFVTERDQGEYRCRAANRNNVQERWMRLKIRNRKGNSGGSGFEVLAPFLVLVMISLALMTLRINVCQRLWPRLSVPELPFFAEGQPDGLNSLLPADEQAELLPYDRKWEFPREFLKLGEELGAGAFGVVLKAEARGLVRGEEVTTVAVKTVRRTAHFSCLRALASELKILVHLGQHLNVVNLLGACTGGIRGRELLVIVEFCRFGNLHDFLLRHREGFVDQVDPLTGAVDGSIGANRLARAHRAPIGRSDNGATPEPGDHAPGSSDHHASADDNGASGSMNLHSESHETIALAHAGQNAAQTGDESAQPHWRSIYRGDYSGNYRIICTRDLLCWAYQVARGMEYLASRKVLHGDLAARNILLADDNVVKICDFGLARNMYKSDNYKKESNCLLPVKWMALESIRDGIFSTQSDVWAFGVALWELFSLAKTPYPGLDVDAKFCNKLEEGYRMERPPYATQGLHEVMLRCWDAHPGRRPSFEELADRLGAFLEDGVRQYYVDLNNVYVKINEQSRCDGATDYLAMMGTHDYCNLVTPCTDHLDDGDGCTGAGANAQDGAGSSGSPSGYLPMLGAHNSGNLVALCDHQTGDSDGCTGDSEAVGEGTGEGDKDCRADGVGESNSDEKVDGMGGSKDDDEAIDGRAGSGEGETDGDAVTADILT